MKMRVLVWLGSAALGVALHAQQTGTVVGRTPGSALGQRLPTATEVPRPAPACDSPAAPHIPTPGLAEMVFSRMMDDLICLRHPDGRSELLLRGGPWTALSPDGNDVAYWLPEKHELHVFSIADRRDNIVDT